MPSYKIKIELPIIFNVYGHHDNLAVPGPETVRHLRSFADAVVGSCSEELVECFDDLGKTHANILLVLTLHNFLYQTICTLRSQMKPK